MSADNPYTVPPFEIVKKPVESSFTWWSWHPNYTTWSKSCWTYPTKEEALKSRETAWLCGLDLYHNKLIRSDEYGHEEVHDDPCRRLDVWRKIHEKAAQQKPHES